jgi:molecular chaperone DnaJ
MQLTLEECATGVSRPLTVDTAVLCSPCEGSGCEPGTRPKRCDTCGGAGEIQNVQRSFLGQVVTTRPCPVCRGLGEVIPDPCRQCGGDGRVRARRKVTVKVPAGVGDGMRVRLAGQGEVGPGGGAPGDLYVEGTEEIRVEPGTQCGAVLTLPGKGMPRLRISGRVDGRGDLFVQLDVVTPTRLDSRQTELLRELAALRGEEQSELAANGRAGGLFSRLRDSFGGR